MASYRLTEIACTISIVMTLAACSDQPASPTAPSGLNSSVGTSTPATSTDGNRITVASAPSADPSSVNFETKFMTDMIDHHHMAVMMAEVCLVKAVHLELRSMCENIIATQAAEIAQMQTWLRDWYGITYEPTMKPGDEKMLDRLASLSGAEFESAFMEMMIMHHKKALREARHCLDKAAHPELRALCENIIATQSAEIAQMQTWLCQWYGACH